MNVQTTTYRNDSKKLWIGILVFALAILAIGVYIGFIKSAGYVRSTGVIVSVREEVYDDDGDKKYYYFPTVSYTVDGKEYTGELDISDGNNVGGEVSIQYDPQDPSKVHSYSPVIVIIIFVMGGILFLFAVFRLISVSRQQSR